MKRLIAIIFSIGICIAAFGDVLPSTNNVLEDTFLSRTFCNSSSSLEGSFVMFILRGIGHIAKPGECQTVYIPKDYTGGVGYFEVQIHHANIKTHYNPPYPFAIPSYLSNMSNKVCVKVQDCNKDQCNYTVSYLGTGDPC